MRQREGLARRLWLLALALAALACYGVVGYILLGFSVPNAFYTTLLALVDNGSPSAASLSVAGKAFTMSLVFLGVAVFLVVLGQVGSAAIEGALTRRSKERRMSRRVVHMKDHYILCAYGRVGRTVARELEAEGAPYVVIESRVELEADLQRDGVAYLLGSPSSEEMLKAAGIDRARGVVCTVDSDAENVYITLMARSLNAAAAIVSRAAQPESADRLRRAGATRVVSPYTTSGRRMALLALRPSVVDFFEIAGRGSAEVRLEELVVQEGSELIGRSLAQACGAAVPLLVRRAGGELLASPAGSVVLEEGDTVVIFGDPPSLRPIELER
ncbi:MAG: potassium channel family protein [Acidimicrobiales bacterium]